MLQQGFFIYSCIMDLEKIVLEAGDLCKQVGAFILSESKTFDRNRIEEKSLNQLVSYVDKSAEEMLVKGMNALLPGAGFITEEATIATQEKEWMWIIDPLDGTTNFMHGLPVYSISIGLMQGKQMMAGLVYEINRSELFYAWHNSPAYLNGEVIRVSVNNKLSDTLLATGFPYYDFNLMQQYLGALQEFLKGSRGMRRMGSAAVDLAYVACGRFDGFFEYGLSPWDVAGGAFIVQRAGGVVSDFGKTDNFLFGKEIIACAPGVYEALTNIISKKFGR